MREDAICIKKSLTRERIKTPFLITCRTLVYLTLSRQPRKPDSWKIHLKLRLQHQQLCEISTHPGSVLANVQSEGLPHTASVCLSI